jgi:hypothetical protein
MKKEGFTTEFLRTGNLRKLLLSTKNMERVNALQGEKLLDTNCHDLGKRDDPKHDDRPQL